jgi:hypothetical protein
MMKKLLLLVFITAGIAGKAQTIKNQATFRTLKTATSLLEAQQKNILEKACRVPASLKIYTARLLPARGWVIILPKLSSPILPLSILKEP